MRFVPYDPDFDHLALNPFEALKFAVSGEGRHRISGAAVADVIPDSVGTEGYLMLSACGAEDARRALAIVQPRHLWLQGIRLSDLALLDGMENLRSLILTDMPELEKLGPVEGFRNVTGLVVEDCSRLTDFGSVAHLSDLTLLRLSGPNIKGGWKKVDLGPLAKLRKLRHLCLAGLRTVDEKLTDLAGLPPLETLDLDGGWPARELARMAAAQPHLVRKSTFLKPVVASVRTRSGSFFDINPDAYPVEKIEFMVTGKRGASGLRPERDAKKLARVSEQWRAWLAAFAEDPAAP